MRRCSRPRPGRTLRVRLGMVAATGISSHRRPAWLFEMPDPPMSRRTRSVRPGLDQIIDGPCRDPLDAGLLDHGGRRFLRQPPAMAEPSSGGAAQGSRESTCPCAAWECAVPRHPRGFPGRAPCSRCAALFSPKAAPITISVRRPAAKPGMSRRTSASGPFREGRAGSSCRQFSRGECEAFVRNGSPVAERFATRSYRRITDGQPAPVRASRGPAASAERGRAPEPYHVRGHDRR